jgi:hypothetical protein
LESILGSLKVLKYQLRLQKGIDSKESIPGLLKSLKIPHLSRKCDPYEGMDLR